MTEMISLGGRDFTLRPPTLGQLRHLLDALDEMAGASGGALIDAAAKLVAAGLAAAHPEITVAAVLDCTATLAELNTAVAAILKLAGLSPVGEDRPVAMSAAVKMAPMPSSALSTPPSPPAAATATATSTL